MKLVLNTVWIVIIDFLAAIFVWLLFYRIREDISGSEVFFDEVKLISIGFIWLLVYALAGFYTEIYQKSRIKELLTLFFINLLGVVFIFFVVFLDDPIDYYKLYYQLFVSYLVLHTMVTAIAKMVALSITKYQIRKGYVSFETIIIGDGASAKEIYEEMLKINTSQGLNFLGYVQVAAEPKKDLEEILPSMGSLNDINQIIQDKQIKQVIIALEEHEYKNMPTILSELKDQRIKIAIIPDMYQILIGSVKVNHLLGVPLIQINPQLLPVWQKVFKRVFDILFSIAVLVTGFPFLLFIALMTKLTSKGPIFYTQVRIGKNGRPFHIIKFRSMYTDAEQNGPELSSETDTRVTPWGRVMRRMRIDELPQFVNVLMGDMAIVGPRPERKYFIDKISEKAPHYKELLRVKPGITSLGQVKYGYAENVEQMIRRMKYDILYIENMSLSMDVRILFYTIIIILQGRGK